LLVNARNIKRENVLGLLYGLNKSWYN
jgi:hypothetical protein